MRKIIVEAEVSLDGAMGTESMDFWEQVFPFHTPDVQKYLDELLFMPDALLMGQKTYSSSPRSGQKGKGNRRIGSTACPSMSPPEP